MLSNRFRRFRGIGAGIVGLGLTLGGCDGASSPSPNALGAAVRPPLPPSDGLLGDTALQRVVGAQATGQPSDLLAALFSQRPSVSARGIFALGSAREDFTVLSVREQLTSPDSAVRSNATFTLGQLPRPASTRWLLDAIRTESIASIRAELTAALGKVGDETAGDLLIAQDPQVPEAVRTLALSRLALRHPPGEPTLNRLLQGLESRDGEVRELAAWYFGRTGDVAPWAAHADRIRRALSRYGAADPAAAGLIRALARLGDPEDLGIILAFQGSPDWRLRVRTATALAAFVAEDSARSSLLDALDDPSTHVSVAAANSLATLRRLLPDDMDRIVAWIDDHPDDWRTASPLLATLAAQGRAGFVADWLEQRSNAPARVQAHGIRALARTPDQAVTRTLMQMAASDTVAIATAALAGLVERWDGERDNRELHRAYWDTFQNALLQGDRAAVVTVAPLMPDSVFQAFGASELLAQVWGALVPVVDLEAQQAVISALEALADATAAEVLERAVADPHRTIRTQAAESLRRAAIRRVEPGRALNPPARAPDWTRLRSLGPHPTLVLETTKGTIRVRMTTELTPVTVQTVSEFAEAGRYDGVPFHRVVPDFVIQGGDFERGDGYGGPGFALRTEISGVPFLRGVVGLAAAGPDTEGSQFFVTHSRQPHLDDAYVAFGWVEEGMDVVDRIYEGDRIETARVEADPTGTQAGAEGG